jgi:uncharacterized protein DUF6454
MKLRRHAMRARSLAVLALAIEVSACHASGSMNPAAAALDALLALGDFKGWRQVAAIELPFETYHPQGLAKIGATYYLSTVDRTGMRGYLVAFALSDGPLETAVAREIGRTLLADGDNPERYHPGGIDLDDRSGGLWVPLAEYRADSSATLFEVDAELHARRIAGFGDHVGGLIVDRELEMFRLFDWDIGVYSVAARSDGSFPIDAQRFPPFVHGSDPEYGPFQYQDCKHIARAHAICSGVVGIAGVVDVIRFDGTDSQSASYRVVRRTKVPQISRAGDTMGFAVDDPPLSNNPFTFEVAIDGAGRRIVRLYFVPHDGPGSHLFIYEI